MLPLHHPMWTIDARRRVQLYMRHAGLGDPGIYHVEWDAVAHSIEEYVAMLGEDQIEEWHVLEFFREHWTPRPNDTEEPGIPDWL